MRSCWHDAHWTPAPREFGECSRVFGRGFRGFWCICRLTPSGRRTAPSQQALQPSKLTYVYELFSIPFMDGILLILFCILGTNHITKGPPNNFWVATNMQTEASSVNPPRYKNVHNVTIWFSANCVSTTKPEVGQPLPGQRVTWGVPDNARKW